MAGKRTKLNDMTIVAGIILIVAGIYELAQRAFSSWWSQIVGTALTIMAYSWPIAIIVAGLFTIHAARSGKVAGVAEKHFRRSTGNKKIAGICGGIADYLDADAGLVRIVSIILLVVTLGTAGLVYLLLWLIVPSQEE